MIALYVLIAVVVLFLLFVIGVYNSLVRLKNKANEAWADIETQLKRRWDLVPNLVATVQGYATHEKSTLENVTKARSGAMQAKTPHDMAQAENFLTETLKSLFALSENYPELKANQNFLDLQQNLRELEEHIQLSRRYYNGTVRDFNNKIETFPSNIIANMFSFSQRDFFEAGEEAQKNVKVDFSQKETPAKEEPTAKA